MGLRDKYDISIAISAFQKGDFAAAEKVCKKILSCDYSNGGANYILALIASQKGSSNLAIRYFRKAISFAPNYLNYRIALSSHYLETDKPWAAIKELEIVLYNEPNSIAAHTNIGTAFKKIGSLEQAIYHFDKACLLLRKPLAESPGNQENQLKSQQTFFVSRQSKLEHDLQQLEFLYNKYPHKKDFKKYAEKLKDILLTFSKRNKNNNLAPFSDLEYAKVSYFYNKLLHRPVINNQKSILGEHKFDINLNKKIQSHKNDIMIIDEFLSKDTLANAQQYCLESTVWFDTKNNSRYLGAYLHDGFIPDFTLGINSALKEKWGDLFAGRVLKQLWAFKYDSEGGGSAFHADDASLNINLWITPDTSCLDPENSGLTIYPVTIPDGMPFSHYNNDISRLKDLISAGSNEELKIPYKCNRAVIFRSKFIHKTSDYKFISGYRHRRINITFLFD